MDHSDPLGLYHVLGLTPSVTARQIKAAFRKRSKETHPDSSGRASAEEFRQVSSAYEVLGDPVRRKKYDVAARELDEEPQAAREEAPESARWVAQRSASRAVRSYISRVIVIISTVLVGYAFATWMTAGRDDMIKAEILRAQERDADISRRFPTCANPPDVGTFFGPDGPPVGFHSIRVENQSLYNMIAKVRDVKSGRVVASFFIPHGFLFDYNSLPDGEFKLQYAFGSRLDVSCKNLLEPIVISESPEITLKENTPERFRRWQLVSYRFLSPPEDHPATFGRYGSSAYYYVRVPLADFLKS